MGKVDSNNRYNNRLYKDLSWTWPIISPPEDYIEESEFILKQIRKYQKCDVKSVLNLGCGGGHVDWALKKELKITGVDISENMLALAGKLNPEAEYILGDMRSVRLNRTFDAVLLHDAINYMTTPEDFRAAFLTAFEHLQKDGLVLTFAEEWKEHFVQNRGNQFTRSKGNIEITFIDNCYDPDPTDTSYEYTIIYLIRKDKKLDIQYDFHHGGLFPLSFWKRTLTEVGFKVFEVEKMRISHENGEVLPVFIGQKMQ